jgi:hypothetical protein
MRLDKIRCLLLLATALGAVLVITGCGLSYTAPNNPPPPPPATTVTVTPPTATLYRGETVRFSAQVSGPSDKTVTWSVPAGFGSIDIVVGGFELQDLVSPLATAELYQ